MAKISIKEARAVISSCNHLYYATKDVNYWAFSEEPVPSGYPATTIALYTARDKKTGIKQVWPIDEADVRARGNLENVYKAIHRSFAKTLVTLGQAIDRARYQNSPLILPKHMKHQQASPVSARFLLKGDHEH